MAPMPMVARIPSTLGLGHLSSYSDSCHEAMNDAGRDQGYRVS